MIELFRDYWWVAIAIAAGIVVVTHALLVKLIAASEKSDQQSRDADR